MNGKDWKERQVFSPNNLTGFVKTEAYIVWVIFLKKQKVTSIKFGRRGARALNK